MVSGSLQISPDGWLSEMMHREVFKVAIQENLLKARSPGPGRDPWLQEYLTRKPVFIYAKVPVTDLLAVSFLEAQGFNLVDTNMVFEKPLITTQDFQGNCTVRFALPEDRSQVAELARTNFVYSRFHLDRLIPDSLANAVKAAWAENFFFQKRGDQMVVAQRDDKVVGFLQLLYGGNHTLMIDLIGVDGQSRRQGIARDMIAFAETNLSRFKTIRVGTQLANFPSLRLYGKLGFIFADASHNFHYHHL